MNKFMQFYSSLTPDKKRFLRIGGAIAVILLFVWLAASMGGNDRAQRQGKKTINSVLTDSDPRQVGLDSINSTQAEQGRKITELSRNVKTLLEQTQGNSEVRDQLKNVESTFTTLNDKLTSTQDQLDIMQTTNKELQQKLVDLERKGSPAGKAEANDAEKAAAAKDAAKSRQRYEGLVQNPNRDQTAFFANAPVPVQEITKPGQASRKEEGNKIREISEAAPEVEEGKEKDTEVYLPAGSIMSGALITGVDAPTGNGAKKEPFPILLRVKKEAVLPNRFRADIRECFLIAAGYGDLSSERAYMRAETISCVRDDGGVIESGIDAYASGEDGKAGVRGRLISKQGAILARSLMAGFMQGVSEAFNVRQVPSINVTGSSSGDDSDTVAPVYEQAFNADSMQGAAVGGAGRALERIADFYLEMAENLYPVIEVDAAREIDFIVKKGVMLKLKNPGA